MHSKNTSSRNTSRARGAATGLALALVLAGCGSQEDAPAQPEEESSSTAAASTGSAEPSMLPGATSRADETPAGEPNGSPAPEPSQAAGAPSSTAEPGPNDVSGGGVVVPSPSPAVEGDGRAFPGFVDQSTVDRTSAEEVAIEAMRGLSVWDTTVDTKPGDAGARVASLVTDEALERGAGGPGRWTPMWWRQATAAGAWSSADTELAPLSTDAQPPEGVELITVEVSWQWHAEEDEVVPEGGAHACTVAVEDVDGEQTVTAFDCQDNVAQAEDMST